MPPPKKRQRTSLSPTPRRKSLRSATTGEASNRNQSPSLSALSTASETSVSWQLLKTEAIQRVSEHHAKGRKFEDKLEDTLNAFLEWLPESGCSSIARDMISAEGDDELYDVFHNLVTGLAIPSEFRTSSSRMESR